ncbi:MAG: SAM-dependent methyltransferase [Alphaproteobacteria bacterium]|nr:SAM-dependent methyltransferase [Alphaproteobacteria bacterium]
MVDHALEPALPVDWQKLWAPEIKDFIRKHDHVDVAALALKKPPAADWPYALIMDQIKARQKAKSKLPRWVDGPDNLLFPLADILEQASSGVTARYKASLIKGKIFCDLTGGAGVDSCALSEHYTSGTCIDIDKKNAALLAHNLPLLCPKTCSIKVSCFPAEEFVKTMPSVDLVLLDPQRRDSGRKGKFRLEDGSPDILALLPHLRTKASAIMLKTSPVLDITQALELLGCVQAVHILEWRGECREVVYIMGGDRAKMHPLETIPITAVRLDDEGCVLSALTFTRKEEGKAHADYALPERYLYEPGPAFLKAGGFSLLATHYGLKKLHKHTHLYTAQALCTDFPGRIFEIAGRYPVQRKALPFSKAHLAVRNFPDGAESLKKKLGLKDGGEEFLFACTLADESKALLHGRKVGAG